MKFIQPKLCSAMEPHSNYQEKFNNITRTFDAATVLMKWLKTEKQWNVFLVPHKQEMFRSSFFAKRTVYVDTSEECIMLKRVPVTRCSKKNECPRLSTRKWTICRSNLVSTDNESYNLAIRFVDFEDTQKYYFPHLIRKICLPLQYVRKLQRR
jgi:hypothetical protein